MPKAPTLYVESEFVGQALPAHFMQERSDCMKCARRADYAHAKRVIH